MEEHAGWKNAWTRSDGREDRDDRWEHTKMVWNEHHELRARIQRIQIAEGKVVAQNDFAAVGAGPNRFCLGWGS